MNTTSDYVISGGEGEEGDSNENNNEIDEEDDRKVDNKYKRKRSDQPEYARRKSHKLAEKKRRDRFNEQIKLLDELVPPDEAEGRRRKNKTQSLERAVEYLRKLQDTNVRLESDVKELHEELQALKRQKQHHTPMNMDRLSEGYHSCDDMLSSDARAEIERARKMQLSSVDVLVEEQMSNGMEDNDSADADNHMLDRSDSSSHGDISNNHRPNYLIIPKNVPFLFNF
mmetsp:Transcript_24859/g.27669  ORF Transcript_24859/g.27669 Transcript_24859/m.27669 type:complete len:227 (-) Transcript_24859:94-774(-)